jgi:hypothetical protein
LQLTTERLWHNSGVGRSFSSGGLKMSIRWLAILILTLSSSAFAFGLSDHQLITRQAVAEYNVCAQAPLSDDALDELVRENLDEDLNLIRKWGHYSHYYHPEKPLQDLHRLNSSMRIVSLLARMQRSQMGLDDLGHAIHHLQDMASPPHVVPVRHGLNDGFEGFDLNPTEQPFWEMSAERCAGLESWRASFRGDLMTLLDEAALETLQRARTPWAQLFWIERSGPRFGAYGSLGNSFGKEGTGFPRSEFATFKRNQLRLAVDTTKRALVWAYGL